MSMSSKVSIFTPFFYHVLYCMFTVVSSFLVISRVRGGRLMEVKTKKVFEEGDTIHDWKIETKLGEGGFGCVYKVHDAKRRYFALKTEDDDAPRRLLKMDVLVLREMEKRNARHFCRVKETFNVKGVNVLVMTLVGACISDLRRLNPKKCFSLVCALRTAIQFLEALQELHSGGFIHRDVKSANFAIERYDPRHIVLIDFGMCRRFVDSKDNKPRKPRRMSGFRGTITYASIGCHMFTEQCRKDDLESWVYCVVEFTVGHLPWSKETNMDLVLGMKMKARESDLASFLAACPKEYVDILNYVDDLGFYETPDYEKLNGILKSILAKHDTSDPAYDWEKCLL